MKSAIQITDQRTLITFAPENDTDLQAIRLLCVLENASIVRRMVKGERVTCLLVTLEEESNTPTLFEGAPEA